MFYTNTYPYLGNYYYNGGAASPRNAVLEVTFSDQQPIGTDNASTILPLVYTAEGLETSFHDDNLEGAFVISVTRDGLNYSKVEEFSETTKKEFIHYPATIDPIPAGTIVFHPGLPAMETDEDAVIEYVPEGLTATGLTEPVTLDEAKNWLKVRVTDDDVVITALITAAREYCEGYTNLSFAPRTVTAILKNQLGDIRLPYGPVNAITIMYDYNGDEITTDNYTLNGVLGNRICYPTYDYIKVIYTAGYSVLPKQLKTALLMQIAWLYVHRGDEEGDKISPDAKAILNPYRTVV